MLFFAILSMPLFLLIIKERIKYKDFILFFVGIITSQFLSISMWALGTLSINDSDVVLAKSINYILVDMFPVILLFLFLSYNKFNKKDFLVLSDFFVYGFLYWTMLFTLLTYPVINSNSGVLTTPIIYLIFVFIYNYLNLLNFDRHNVFTHRLLVALMPVFLLISEVLSIISLYAIIVFIFISIFLLYLLKRKLMTKVNI